MGHTRHELTGAVRASDAVDLRATLAEALARGDVEIATAGLESIDSAIVQVLLSAQRTAEKWERNLQIELPDAGALATMLDRLALRAAFGPSQA
jgi:ABC-type transporter Mla MlaB component